MAAVIPPGDAAAFLSANGFRDAEIQPLTGDASFRRYFRVLSDARHAMLMDAPPPHEDPQRFLAMARWLTARGFKAPQIYGADDRRGLVLLEDFGDARMREVVDADPSAADTLYREAIDVLIGLRRHAPDGLSPYDRSVLHREADLFADWYCLAVGIGPDIDAYRRAWSEVLSTAIADTPVAVLRDYHSENLMVTSNGLGLLDFQDALAGHPAYDLVSLLQDARRDVPVDFEAGMLDYYCSHHGDGPTFLNAYRVLGAQRNAKILGIFTRLWKRDGKTRYPSLCVRVWEYLERDLANPVLAPVAEWFDRTVPSELRGDPLMLAR